jgi:DNA-binding protein HU-alpha
MSGKSSSKSSGAGVRKSTPAGRKGVTSPTRKSSRAKDGDTAATPAEQAAQARTHLRAVTVDPETPQPEAVGTAPDPDAAGSDTRFKRPDLLEAVSERTAMKRSDAKVVLDLVLEELGKALDHNDELVLQPLGKLMVKNRKPDADGPDILTIKLRRPRPGNGATDESPLADPGEDG